MRGMLLVARRELAAYLNSYWGYAVIAAVLVIDGLLFNAFALGNQPKYSSKVIEEFFYFSFGTTVIASILLTMRLVAEERQTGTIVLIDSSPLGAWQLIGGKYLSAMVVLATMVLATMYMPALVFVNGKVSYGHIFAGSPGCCWSRRPSRRLAPSPAPSRARSSWRGSCPWSSRWRSW